MLWIKWLHVLGMVIYAGGFLALTRLLGHAVRFPTAASRDDSYRVFRRMHKFVDWGGLGIVLATGLVLLIKDPWAKHYMKQGYFHMKLTCVVVLLLCDAVFSRKLFSLRGEGPQPNAAFFKAMHGVAALAVLGALLAIFVVRG